MFAKPKIRVLFVCMGNICRSPTAEGVFRHHVKEAGLARQVAIDSAGTHAYHVGAPPDERARAAATRRRYDLGRQRARQVTAKDFETFDYVLAMDSANLAHLHELSPAEARNKVRLFLDFATAADVRDVPDPYYGSNEGFERVLDLVEQASRGLLADVERRLKTL